jgi:CheY-like chemotaxis protein
LKLIILGSVLRSDGGGTAVKALCHEFRVCSAITLQHVGRDTDLAAPSVIREVGEGVHGKGTVLLADDDESIQNLAAAILSAMGFQVLRARDGHKALLQSQEYKRGIDILLSDIQMGPDMTGIELATRLQLERPDTRILLMSGANFETEVQNAGWEFIRKPFLPDSLKRKVQSLLGAR